MLRISERAKNVAPALTVALALPGGLLAQTAGTGAPANESRPASAPSAITIRGVVGKVACKAPGASDRVQAKIGDVISEGTEITTGLRSQVQFQVGTGQVFTLDRVGRVLVREAIARLDAEGQEKTTVELPYGRVMFEVSTATVANDVQIQAPDATLAVKGTLGLMEVAAGFPTLSYGGPGNTGRFSVAYRSGTKVDVTSEEKTDAESPLTAENALADLYVEVSDGSSRLGDELGFVYDFSTLFQLAFDGFTNVPGIAAVPPATGLFAIDEDTGQLIQYDFNDPLGSIVLAETSNAGFGQFVGAATRPSALPGGGTQFLRLVDDGDGSAFLLGLDLGRGQTAFTMLADFSSFGGRFEGLGTLGNDIFSTFNDRIVRLNVPGASITPVGDFGDFELEGGLSAFTSRGTLLIPGRFLSAEGSTFGLFGPGAAIIEFDPRTNYIRSAFTDFNGDFTPDPFDSFLDFGIDPAFNTVENVRFVGIGRFAVVLGGGVGVGEDAFAFLINYTADVNGTPTVITALYNGGATRQIGDPQILLAGPTGRNIRDFSGETGGAPAASVPLAAAPASIDMTLPVLFRELAFSQQAFDSGFITPLVEGQVLSTAADPIGCIQSGALANLPGHLMNHVNRRMGVGGAVFQFRNELPPGHPCRPPAP
ncbi:MAG: FecR domain-containing protein [Phycisphaerales bacterium]